MHVAHYKSSILSKTDPISFTSPHISFLSYTPNLFQKIAELRCELVDQLFFAYSPQNRHCGVHVVNSLLFLIMFSYLSRYWHAALIFPYSWIMSNPYFKLHVHMFTCWVEYIPLFPSLSVLLAPFQSRAGETQRTTAVFDWHFVDTPIRSSQFVGSSFLPFQRQGKWHSRTAPPQPNGVHQMSVWVRP